MADSVNLNFFLETYQIEVSNDIFSVIYKIMLDLDVIFS